LYLVAMVCLLKQALEPVHTTYSEDINFLTNKPINSKKISESA